MVRPIRVRSVVPQEAFRVHLEFTDGTHREVDLSVFLRGPIFEAIRQDSEVFRRVRVDERAGTIVWPNGADIDPDVLYEGLKPAWMESDEEALKPVGSKQ